MFCGKYRERHRNNRELKGCIFLFCAFFMFINIKSAFPYLVNIFICSWVCDVYTHKLTVRGMETHYHRFSFPKNVCWLYELNKC